MDLNKLLYFEELEKLDLPREDFAISGSCPLVIRGLKQKNSDIDIVVKKKLWDKLSKIYPVTVKNIGNRKREFILIGHIDLAYSMVAFFDDCEKVIDRADLVEGYRFVNLDDTKYWKSYLNRDKDVKDLEKIEEYLSRINKDNDAKIL